MIITEEQEIFINYLYKYSQYLYKFSDYNNICMWFKKEAEIDNTIKNVMSGNYKDDLEMLDYINCCILDVEELKREMN